MVIEIAHALHILMLKENNACTLLNKDIFYI